MPKKKQKQKTKETHAVKNALKYLDNWIKETDKRAGSLEDSHWNWILHFRLNNPNDLPFYMDFYGAERVSKMIGYQKLAIKELERNEEQRREQISHFDLKNLLSPVKEHLSKILLKEDDFECKKQCLLYLKLLDKINSNVIGISTHTVKEIK